jgi:hypothetical protein
MDFKLFEEMKARIKENDRFLIYITATIILPAETGGIILFILEKRKPFSKRRLCWIAMN